MPRPVPVLGTGITLDKLLWRAFGRAGNTAAMLRAAQRLNRGLSALGPEIPLGTVVILPDAPTASARATRAPVNLFDE